MILFLLVLLVRRSSGDVGIEGEMSVRLKSPGERGGVDQVVFRFGQQPSPGQPGQPGQPGRVTAGSVVECNYQYPEKEQVDAILSNMMNTLTKVFVRAHEFFAEAEETRRGADTRFRVVEENKARFFEHIYHNMTQEYSNLYAHTAHRAQRAEHDPCRHQQEIKEVWRALLDNSLATFRRAALQTVAEQLRVLKSGDNTRNRLSQYLMRELAKIRSEQLQLLCDNFQLCYNDLQT